MLTPVKLSDDESQKAIAWLDAKWPLIRRQCPLCAQMRWTIHDSLMEVREFEGGNLVLGGGSSLYPMLGIMCQNCGYTHLVNAVVAGLVSQPEPPNEERPE